MKKKKHEQNKIELEKQREEQALTREENQKTFKAWAEAHNTSRVTRRDFLGMGVIPFAASFSLPTLTNILLSNTAHAQDCPAAPDLNNPNRMSAYITLHLDGGAQLASQYVPTDSGGQLLPSYNRIGLGATAGLPTQEEFGAGARFAGPGLSPFLDGLRQTASAATIGNTAFIAMPNESDDDGQGQNDPLDASGMVTAAGVVGQDLPNLGREDTVTGVRAQPAFVRPPNPLRVRSIGDLEGAVGGTGTGALAGLEQNQKLALFNTIKKMNDRQIAKVTASSGGSMLGNLIQCASNQSVTLASAPPPNLDARQDAAVAAAWGINGNTGANNQEAVFASMAMSALRGHAGTVGLRLGGFDYHRGNNRQGANARELQAGQTVGRLLETAAALNQKLFIHVASNGACNAIISDTDRQVDFQNDGGQRGMMFMFAYDPAGRPPINGFQVGQFNAAQAVDTNFITGAKSPLAAVGVFANYLAFNNRLDLFDSVLAQANLASSTRSMLKSSQVVKFA